MNEVSEDERMELKCADPSEAKSVEEFDQAAKCRHDAIRMDMLGDDRMYSLAGELAVRSSPDEIRQKIAGLGNESKKLDDYREATLGDRTTDPRGDRLDGARFAWEDAVSRRAYLDMALAASLGNGRFV